MTAATNYPIRNRFTGGIQFTARIVCDPNASEALKRGLAVRWALKNGADLTGADLTDVDLTDADMRGAEMVGADMRGAEMTGADMRGSKMAEAALDGAKLEGADMRGADLRWAKLTDADLTGAALVKADMRGADLAGADLAEADLREAKLDGVSLSPFAESLRPQDPAEARARLLAVARAALASPDALDMGCWHNPCGTSQCLSGWSIHLAGEDGAKLEDEVGPHMAGAVLLGADVSLRFHDGTETTRAWLEGLLAEAEGADA